MNTRFTLKKKYDKLGLFKKDDSGVISLFERPQFSIMEDVYFFNEIIPLKKHNMLPIDRRLNGNNMDDLLRQDRFTGRYSTLTFIFYTDSKYPTLKEVCETIPIKIYNSSRKIYVNYEENHIYGNENNYFPFVGKYCNVLNMFCVDKRFSSI
jgi:hypothetical protein